MLSLQSYPQKTGLLHDAESALYIEWLNKQKSWYPKQVKAKVLYVTPQVMAEAAGVRTVFPQGYTSCIATYQNKHIRFAHDPRDFEVVGNKTLELLKTQPNFFETYTKNFYQSSERLRELAHTIYFDELPPKNKKEITLTLQNLVNATLIPQSYGFYTEIFTFTEHFWVTEYFKTYGHNFSEEELQILFTPTKPSFLDVYKTDLLNTDLSNEEIKNKYYWIKASYNETPELTDTLINADREAVQAQHEAKHKGEQNGQHKFRNLLLEKLSPEVLKLISWIDTCITMQDERKRNVLETNSALSKIVKNISALTGTPEETLLASSLHELIAYLNSSELPESEIEKRNESAVFIMKQDGYEISTNEHDITYISAVLTEHKIEIKGHVACRGKVTGIAKIILSEADFYKMNDGDVLVTSMTRPEFMPILKKASAFVTDEGGVTSHNLITFSLSKNVPCITATRSATSIINNGDKIEVDAEKGIVTILV